MASKTCLPNTRRAVRTPGLTHGLPSRSARSRGARATRSFLSQGASCGSKRTMQRLHNRLYNREGRQRQQSPRSRLGEGVSHASGGQRGPSSRRHLGGDRAAGNLLYPYPYSLLPTPTPYSLLPYSLLPGSTPTGRYAPTDWSAAAHRRRPCGRRTAGWRSRAQWGTPARASSGRACAACRRTRRRPLRRCVVRGSGMRALGERAAPPRQRRPSARVGRSLRWRGGCRPLPTATNPTRPLRMRSVPAREGGLGDHRVSQSVSMIVAPFTTSCVYSGPIGRYKTTRTSAKPRPRRPKHLPQHHRKLLCDAAGIVLARARIVATSARERNNGAAGPQLRARQTEARLADGPHGSKIRGAARAQGHRGAPPQARQANGPGAAL